MKQQRIAWIDYAKGMAILLVIVGHCKIPETVRSVIYSFHMPLFFILSAMTFSLSQTEEQFVHKTEKAILHLLLPMLWISLATTILALFQHPGVFVSLENFRLFAREHILTFCFASGANTSIGNMPIPALGVPWFFAVLFVARTLFDYLHFRLSAKVLIVTSAALSILGVAVAKIQWLPFSLDISLAILPLFLVAKPISSLIKERTPIRQFLITFALWTASFLLIRTCTHANLEVACRYYPAYPLCLVTAIVGTVMIGNLGVIIARLRHLVWMKTVGQYSLYVLFIHIFDDPLLRPVWGMSPHWYIQCATRILIDLTVFVVFLYLKRWLATRRGHT